MLLLPFCQVISENAGNNPPEYVVKVPSSWYDQNIITSMKKREQEAEIMKKIPLICMMIAIFIWAMPLSAAAEEPSTLEEASITVILPQAGTSGDIKPNVDRKSVV